MLSSRLLLGLPSRRFARVDCGIPSCDAVQFCSGYQHLGGTYQTSVTTYKTTRRHNPKDHIDIFTAVRTVSLR
jgi:hypothetical protein